MATNSTIKLISVNIEKHRHIDRVLPFLKRENPDIICFQEILETDFPMFLKKMGFTGYFVPMSTFLIASVSSSEKIGSGLAIMSKFPLEIEVHHYWGSMESVPEHIHGNIPDSYNRMLLVGKLTKNKDKFSIGNTHFTWSKDGLVDDYQKRDIVKLMDILAKYPEIIFCGDMNAPRGKEIFGKLVSKYKDNIPSEITTTIDKNLHRAGDLQHVVDVLFTTPQYVVSDIKIQDGVSDHMAIVAQISISK